MWLHVPQSALSASAPESEGSTSGSSEPVEWSLWSTSSGKPSLQPSSWPGWKKRDWHRLLCGTTSQPSTLARGVDWWISSLAEHRARISASPGSALGWMAAAPGSSSSTSGSPSNARPRSFSGRTSPEQLGLFPASASTSKSEVTGARGPSFVRVTLAPLTSGLESSSWPTPSATPYGTNQGGAAGRIGPVRPGLDSLARQWPTPRSSDGDKGGPNQAGSRGEHQVPSAAAQWPTPTAQDSKASGASGYSTEGGRHSGTTLTAASVRERQWPTPQARDGKGAAADDFNRSNLPRTAQQWPTPSARDWKSGQASQETHARNSRPLNETATDWARSHLSALTSKDGPECLRYDPTSHRLCLNPAFVEWLMGWSDGHTMPSTLTASEPVETESFPSRPPSRGVDSGLTSLAEGEAA